MHTFLFADLAGYTALTEVHGDEEAAEIVLAFTSQVGALLAEHGAEQVKTIGDEVMARVEDPAEAVSLGLRIVDELTGHLAPPIRVGMHTGPAVKRGGDFFGATVNIAARVASAARAGEVLLTEATMAAAGPRPGRAYRPRGERWFKNVPQRIGVYAAHDDGTTDRQLEIDPVCRMAVEPGQAAASIDHRGSVRYFCSDRCRAAFVAEPRRYLGNSPSARSARHGFLTHLRVFAAAQIVFLGLWGSSVALGASAYPWFAFVLAGWGIPLALHYRAVRSVL